MNSDIEDIIRSKSFGELNDDEKKLVLSQVSSKEEYENIRFVLGQIAKSREEEEALVPSQKTAEDLMKKFREKQSATLMIKPKREISLTFRRLSIAAAILCGLLACIFLYRYYSTEKTQVADKNTAKDTVITNNIPDATESPKQDHNNHTAQTEDGKMPFITHHDTVKLTPLLYAINKDTVVKIDQSRTLKDDELLTQLLFTAL